MNNRAVLGLLGIGAVLGAVALSALNNEALADKTTCYVQVTADAVSDEMHFYKQADAGVEFSVCGHTTYADGGVTPGTCTTRVAVPNGGIRTNVLNLFNGQGLDYWKTKEELQ